MERYKAVIIDDEVWTRQVIRSLGRFEEYGIDIAGEASDGEYGLELIRQVRPDIIVTDVCMPHLSGLELVESLREGEDGAQVIFVSGYDDYSYIRSAFKLDVVDYLLKPVKEEELNRQLEVCVERLSHRGERGREESLPADFVGADWAGDFYRCRDELRRSLSSEDVAVMERRFGEMRRLLAERVDGEPGKKGEVIGVYCSLMDVLQQYVLGRGYTPGEVFGERNTTFVFGRECTAERMLAFVEPLYREAMERTETLTRQRGRLDLDKVRGYVEEHFQEGLTLEETAARFYVSKEYLSKCFKSHTGKGFSEFLTGLRMEKAKALIVDERIPIKDAGAMVGYVDQAHFYKTFKKYFGITPGGMRED